MNFHALVVLKTDWLDSKDETDAGEGVCACACVCEVMVHILYLCLSKGHIILVLHLLLHYRIRTVPVGPNLGLKGTVLEKTAGLMEVQRVLHSSTETEFPVVESPGR